MDREKFGNLIQELRKEIGLTRDELAQEMKVVNSTIIRDIEIGRRKRINDEELIKLAKALRLTSRERREFFFASTGLDEEQASHPHLSQRETLEEMLRDLQDFRVPWLLLDKYLYMLATHPAVPRFYNLSAADLAGMFEPPVLTYNLMSIQFSSLGQKIYQTVGEAFFERLAFRTMHTFRASTLKYRFNQDFIDLHQELKKFPLFNAYWQQAAADDEDELTNHSLQVVDHVQHGKLKFFILLSSNPTPYGELYLALYLPADLKCEQVFRSLSNDSPSILHWAQWRK